ncbi:MAPK regulated corepressor interacting protein 2 [Episyrphus balteatus]|uniref:MAPK regulated corepressor interacting protein 2 n=1 Tax=Episyrphus balteatus TaxID=286459 RepID=UPI002485D0DC|nr:MAPK regulated corepressor interacting protein 2 [Episyrphus balteatus]
MYTVSKGPSKIVAKTRRGLAQNYEKFETIKESGKKTSDLQSPEAYVPKAVFQTSKKSNLHSMKPTEEEVLTPQHEEIIQYINESWNNIIVADNPYDTNSTDSNNYSAPSSLSSVASSASSSPLAPSSPAPVYCVEPPSPVLSDFKPFDLESWWGRRLFQNITKNL